MKNIEEIIFDKISSKLSFKKFSMPSIMDENVRSKGIDHILLPTMNQIIFNICNFPNDQKRHSSLSSVTTPMRALCWRYQKI
jgi:hypothetical protein